MLSVSCSAVQTAMLAAEVGTVELAKRSGLPTRAISNFATGDRAAQMPTIAKLARALNVEPMSFVKGVVGRGKPQL